MPFVLPSRAMLLTGSALFAVATLLGCGNKDKDKCDEATRVTRQALLTENTSLARQWRDRAYTYCEDTASLTALDGEIVKTEQAIVQRKNDEARRKSEANQLVSLFVDWAGKNQGAGNRAVANPTCQGPEDTKQRWCEGERKVGEKYTFHAQYWEEDPAAALFKARLPHGFDCSALGEHRLIKSWNVGGTSKAHCEFTGGPLTGMQAVMSWVPNDAEAKVFTPKYLERMPGMKAQLQP